MGNYSSSFFNLVFTHLFIFISVCIELVPALHCKRHNTSPFIVLRTFIIQRFSLNVHFLKFWLSSALSNFFFWTQFLPLPLFAFNISCTIPFYLLIIDLSHLVKSGWGLVVCLSTTLLIHFNEISLGLNSDTSTDFKYLWVS